MNNRIPPQTSVRHVPSGRIGVTCPDLMSCCEDEETPVVYDGNAAFEGTLTTELEPLGAENAIADPSGCGMGRGAECCIFLAVGARGFSCERFGHLRFTLQFKKSSMTAQREPSLLYPLCQVREAATETTAPVDHAKHA